ncbi:MAG TPA: M14 family metallopeptidase, partial [Pseudobdellovibrionaceae bacterium]|nr:M14 family metallopeptidase [Pseudobdellovibrionaceae bacterium]
QKLKIIALTPTMSQNFSSRLKTVKTYTLLLLTAISSISLGRCLDYQDCNFNFLKSLEALHKPSMSSRMSPQVKLDEYPIEGTQDSILTALVSKTNLAGKISSKSNRLFIFSSGLHGIEGLVGSSVQTEILKNYDLLFSDKDIDLLMIHIINPSGLKNFRRVNENNVDLNRNFPLSKELYNEHENNLYKTENKDYERITAFLNPNTRAETGFWNSTLFLLQSLKLIVSHGIEPLRRGILKGQYQNNKGIYFGGAQPEPQVQAMDQILKDVYKKYTDILFIDLHTGYGARGQLHLFPSTTDSQKRIDLTNLFKGYPIDFGDHKNFYQVTGSMTDWVESHTPKNVNLKTMAFEYGTMDSQTTMGSIQSLYSVILENQAHFYGAKSEKDTLEIQQRNLNLYAPKDPLWEKSIYEQTLKVLQLLLSNK